MANLEHEAMAINACAERLTEVAGAGILLQELRLEPVFAKKIRNS